jgi:circadian clock protein KaiB
MNSRDDTEMEREEISPGELWHLRLYVNGKTSLKTIVTLQNLTELCENHLAGRYQLEVIDLVEDFAQATEDRIIALPTLVRRSPGPVRKIIGDLSNTDQVMAALGLTGSESDEV